MAGLSEENKLKLKLVLSEVDGKGLRWPKTEEWQGDAGKKKKMQEIYAFLTAREFDVTETVVGLLDKFDREPWAIKAEKDAAVAEEAAEDAAEAKAEAAEAAAAEEKPKKKRAPKKKAEADVDDGEEEDIEHDDGGSPKPKKKRAKKESDSPKKSETFVCEENRGFGAAMLELAGLYYKAGEGMKGGVFSRAAKVIREHPEPLLSGKQAMKEKGIGKGIGGFIDEFLEKGYVDKLEKMRAGEA